MTLNICQTRALAVLSGKDNVFLTGVAGSGKSYLIKHFLKDKPSKTFPTLASTGAAAILVGGRTFHSFFGLGILQGGPEATVQRALSNKRCLRRLKKTEGIVIDEVSMLSGQTIRIAETIARKARGSDEPWGGLKVVAVGDFAQLPPVNPFGGAKDWAFLDETWVKSSFKIALLDEVMRTNEFRYIEMLNHIRIGSVNERVTEFLNARVAGTDGVTDDFDGTRLFPHRETTERYNLTRLQELEGKPATFQTIYTGDERFLKDLKKNAPVPDVIHVKYGALVMIRLNDPQGRFFNGSLGHVESISENLLRIRLMEGGVAELEKNTFSILNAEGAEIASATNFPINLAYAATIHKAQGLTLDKVFVDLKGLWEPGQAYVALSRTRSADGLFLSAWSPDSIHTDPEVSRFNQQVWAEGLKDFKDDTI